MGWLFKIAVTVDCIAILVAFYFLITDFIRNSSSQNGSLSLATLLFCAWVGLCFFLNYQGRTSLAAILAFLPAIPLPGFFSLEIAFSSVLLGIGLLVIGQYMPKKSVLGLVAYQQLAGYRMFMKTVETPQLQQLIKEDPLYFDKSLPYAMVFDLADNWSEKFEALQVPPPTWYSARSGQFTSTQFMRSFSQATKDIGNTFTSMPSKSGSSGGGGFSGGGFGGGGGGSW